MIADVHMSYALYFTIVIGLVGTGFVLGWVLRGER